MPTNKTEKRRDGFFIASEAKGHRSREQDILITGQNLEAGAALGKITASSKVTLWNLGAGDGSEVFYGYLFPTIDATNEDKDVATLVRDCELNEDDLNYFSGTELAAAKAAAEVEGIILRASGLTQTLADQQ